MRIFPVCKNSYTNYNKQNVSFKSEPYFEQYSLPEKNDIGLKDYYVSCFSDTSLKNKWAENEFETTLLKFKDKIASFETDGIPLTYSRKEYLEDLNNILKNSNNDKNADIYSKLSIIPTIENDKITSWEGLLNVKDLNLNDDIERKVFDITYKFLYKNKSNTTRYSLNKAIDTILISYPQFINIIGKKQSEGHKYSTDIHTLEVLINCIDNPEYKNLTKEEKSILELTAIFHDIGKKEGIIDPIHYNTSAQEFLSVSSGLKITKDFERKVYTQIKNHHWLEKLNKGIIEPKDVCSAFKTENQFKLAKILTRADIVAIGNPRYFEFIDALEGDKVKEVEKLFNES